MANPIISASASRLLAEAAAPRAAVAFSTGARAAALSPALIEVGEQPAKAIIVRDGIELKTPTLDKQTIGTYIDKLKRIPIQREPRAIDQSVPPGTRVPKGTVIDLAFAAPIDIDIGVFGPVHADLTARPITDLAVLVAQPAVQELLGRVDDASKLSATDREVLQTAVVAAALPLQLDATPGSERSVDRLFFALNGVKTFL